MADGAKPDETEKSDQKNGNEADAWGRMGDLVRNVVREELGTWQPRGGNDSQHSPASPEEKPSPAEKQTSEKPERQKTTRREGFLSQFFKGLDE